MPPEAAYYGGLAEIVRTTVDYLHKEGRNYYTAQVVLKHLNALGLINDVYEKMMALCRAQNIFMISGTNQLLTRIIANNDTPFIYEKTGTRYAHYMMDEFQDTSSLQYQNFIPLVKDALAGGNYAHGGRCYRPFTGGAIRTGICWPKKWRKTMPPTA